MVNWLLFNKAVFVLVFKAPNPPCPLWRTPIIPKQFTTLPMPRRGEAGGDPRNGAV